MRPSTWITAAAVALLLLSAPSRSAAQDAATLTTTGAGTTAVVLQAAPIFLAPDASRQPLRVAREGSRLRVIESASGWMTVQFQDPQFGLRTGYVESRYVRVEPSAALQPMDLSVVDAPRVAAPSATPPPPATRSVEAQAPSRAAPPVRGEAPVRKSSSDGFWIGAGIEGNGLLSTEGGFNSATESGRGGGLEIGYGFTRRVSLYGTLSVASMDSLDYSGTYALSHVDVGARWHLGSGEGRVMPFLQAALAGRAIAADFYTWRGSYSVAASGAGVSVGGGLNAHFTPGLAFAGSATWTVGNFSRYEVNGLQVPGDSMSATSARVHLGLVWFPGARR